MNWVGKYEQENLKEFLRNAMLAGFGKRIIFGSDGQFWPQSITLAVNFIKKVEYLTLQEKKDILYFNAASFYGLSEEQLKRTSIQ